MGGCGELWAWAWEREKERVSKDVGVFQYQPSSSQWLCECFLLTSFSALPPYCVCAHVWVREYMQNTHVHTFLFAGAAAAWGQVGKCDSGSSTEHHWEVHLPPQIQEGESASVSACVIEHLKLWRFLDLLPCLCQVWPGGEMGVPLSWWRRRAGCACACGLVSGCVR